MVGARLGGDPPISRADICRFSMRSARIVSESGAAQGDSSRSSESAPEGRRQLVHEGQSKGCSEARSRGKCGGGGEQALGAPYRAQHAPGGAASSPSSSRSTASRSGRARIMESDLRQAETAGEHRGGVVGRSTMVLRGSSRRGTTGEAACEQPEQPQQVNKWSWQQSNDNFHTRK